MKFSLQINMKMPTIVCIFIFISRHFHAQLCLTRKNLALLVIWDSLAWKNSCSVEFKWAWKKLYNLGTWAFAVFICPGDTFSNGAAHFAFMDYVFKIQSTLVTSKSKGLPVILRDIRCSTYQICRIKEKINQTTTFMKWICNLTPEIKDVLKYCGIEEKLLLRDILKILV